ncbi:TolC family protein [Paremcibacter congregatus]|uniref:Transporter n=1 Tax=Paremcibacter congregatus TaxID=2043170 RepID=A0A2G4YU02_9PROT|nr:TolC family protein [Paremcibacter congregatus]PHZ85773.1 transporter [Paremcibacter congregatus]QDE26734.1 TolC family protein [Paremcibacter congregatus]
MILSDRPTFRKAVLSLYPHGVTKKSGHHLTCTLILTLLTLSAGTAPTIGEQRPPSGRVSIETAIESAHQNDPWLTGNRHTQEAIESMSIAAGALPDPKLSFDVANLPTNSFNFGQEAMTQVKLGLTQAFPPGDSRALRKRQLELQSSQHPFLREDRKAKVAVTVGQLWLNAYQAQESIAIIEKNRALFEQLITVTETSYAAALGKSRQQDVIRAQLELTRLEDRLTVLHQRQELFQHQLSEWLTGNENNYPDVTRQAPLMLTTQIPDLMLLHPEFYQDDRYINTQTLHQLLARHPTLQAIDQKLKESQTGVELARQKYKPEWALRAGYGYRANDAMGIKRSDLFSLGVTMSIPLFTANRQDKQVQSEISKTSAVKTEKWQMLRKLTASFATAKTQLMRLNQRQKLYNAQLLPQIHEQAEAALTAYTNDDGDFAEAVRARIAEMDAEIDAMSIDVERQKTILQLNYFFMSQARDIVTGTSRSGEFQ